MSLTWNQFAQFCVTAALWFLQQAVTAHQLLAQCSNLTLAELDALRFGFSQYDTELSGLIQASDLHSLLQVSVQTLRSVYVFMRASHSLAYFELQ